jgi:hypothetical protein
MGILALSRKKRFFGMKQPRANQATDHNYRQQMKNKSRAEWTVRKAATILRIDKSKFSALMKENGIAPRKVDNSHLYPVEELVAAAIDYKGELTSTDRRNHAQARKIEAELDIIEQKWIKKADIAKPLGQAVSAINEVIAKLDVSDQDKANCTEQLQILLNEYTTDNE